eukprot:TRINITY_DN12205_c0_g1_i1.p1 TRINITY_DN12205_c0_g1~~TRINITY_DN12205_c0_g1_i1.p1  ORF type:complete len:292 (+),score=85.87 TRINITY_DN12205_c0_g1_i1:60-935(+)
MRAFRAAALPLLAAAASRPQLVSRSPLLYEFADFVSAAEAAHLIALAEGSLSAAECYRNPEDGGNVREEEMRTGQNTVLSTELEESDPVLRSVLERIHRAVMVPLSYGVSTQVTRYGDGEKYELHQDSTMERGTRSTFLLYLSTLSESQGGHTVFPHNITAPADDAPAEAPPPHPAALRERPALARYCDSPSVLRVRPRLGLGVHWFNHHPDLSPDPSALHGSCPVRGGGVKWIMQRWIRWFTEANGNRLWQELLRPAMQREQAFRARGGGGVPPEVARKLRAMRQQRGEG